MDTPISELLVTAPTMAGLGAIAAVGVIKLLAYLLKLHYWNKHQERVINAPADKVGHLERPPEIPEAINKIMILVAILGAMTAALGVAWRGALLYFERHPIEVAGELRGLDGRADLGVSEALRTEGPPVAAVEQLAQACTKASDCGSGCACKEGQCRCAAKRPATKPRPAKDKEETKGPGPSSSLASTSPTMAGEPGAWDL